MVKHLSWFLFAIAVVLLAVMIVKPLLTKPTLKEVAASELYHIGEDADGESWYIIMKHEIKDWMEILVRPLAPFGVAWLGMWAKKRGEKK